MDGNLKFRPLTLPDRYIEHGTQVGRPRPSGEAVLRGRRGMGGPGLVLKSLSLFSPCHGIQAEQLADAGLTASHIAKMALGLARGKATTLVQ